MKAIYKYLPLAVVVIVGVLLQAVFVTADKTDTPNKAAFLFAKAYYLLDDKAMTDQLCKADILTDAVGDYLFRMEKSAADRGFALKYMKGRLYDIHVSPVENSGEKATVRITGKRRTSINPVFEIMAVLFSFGQPREVDSLIQLVKEDGQWKVCGDTFELMS